MFTSICGRVVTLAAERRDFWEEQINISHLLTPKRQTLSSLMAILAPGNGYKYLICGYSVWFPSIADILPIFLDKREKTQPLQR